MSAANEVPLSEARRRVAAATGNELSPWSPDECRWIAQHWGIFRHELWICETYGDEIMEMVPAPGWVYLVKTMKRGIGWWLLDAPAATRAALAAAGLFLAAFMVGWL